MSEVKAAGGSPTLIASALHPRLQRAVNWYGLASLAFATVKAARDRWQTHTHHRVAVAGDDPLYPELEAWLIDKIPAERRKVTRVRYVRPASSDASPEVADWTDGDRPESKATHGNIAVVYDGDVEQPVDIRGHKITVQVTRPEAFTGEGRQRRWQPPEMRFTAHSIDARDAVLDMLAELAAVRASEVRTPAFYITNRWGGFHRMREYHPRRLDSIVLPDDITKPLVDDLAVFLASEARYTQLGIPWHRGYLFTGEPGTGKSSLAAALANHFALDTYFLIPAAIESDDALIQMLAEVTPRSLLVIEDVDVIHASRDRDEDQGGGITTQALLQALDGMVTPHGMVTIMTTNRAEVLDPALTRPGRADLKIEIPKLEKQSMCRLFERFTGRSYEPPDGPMGSHTGSELVEVVKPHIHDPDAMDRAIVDWIGRHIG